MLNIFNKLKRDKKIFQAIIFVMVIAVFFVNINSVAASVVGDTALGTGFDILGGVGKAVALVAGLLAFIISAVIGLIITVLVAILVQVAQFNNIINVPTVIQGWVIIRDLCNMSFILILLIIAFATILRQENFSAKKMLPKLLLMAILINFSRTIFGLLIDFSQVIMLTFVNGFSQYGYANFVNMFQINFWYSIRDTAGFASNSSEFAVNSWSTVVAIIAGVLAAIITLIIISVMLAVLVARIIMLWIYTIFSPLIFLGFAFPPLQKYTGKLWEDFTKQLVVGPVLAFFIWLAMTTASKSSETLSKEIGNLTTNEVCVGAGRFFCSGNLQQFIIVIGLLMGGLMVAQQMGGAAGAIAGKGLDWAKKSLAAPGRLAGYVGKRTMFKAGRSLDTLQMKAQKGLGVEYPKSLNYRMIAAGWEANREKKMLDYEKGTATKTAPLHTMWQETFDKYLQAKQYGTWRKSKKQRTDEAKKKNDLEFDNSVLEDRVRYTDLPEEQRNIEMEKWTQTRLAKKNSYKKRGYTEAEAEARVIEDEEFLTKSTPITPEIKEQILKNKELIQEYEDPRAKWARRKFMVGAGKADPYPFILSQAGDKEREEKSQREMSSRTGERYFAVNSELIKALNAKEDDKLISAFKILTQNNDLNEGLKDKRIIEIMTKNNGILQKMAEKGQFGKMGVVGGEEFNRNLKTLQDDFRANPVTPANAQAMVRGMLEQIGVSEKKAARVSNDIGEKSFVAGNGLLFGSAMGNADTGEFEFEKLNYNNGRLQTSQAKKAAIAGKYTNVESQTKMRMLHPDIFIAEDPTGNASRLSEDGAYFLRNSLSGHDLTQIKRLRPDVVNKIGRSPQVLREIKNLVNELEKPESSESDKEQAKHIRYLTGYIVSKVRGLKPESDDKDMVEAFNTIT